MLALSEPTVDNNNSARTLGAHGSKCQRSGALCLSHISRVLLMPAARLTTPRALPASQAPCIRIVDNRSKTCHMRLTGYILTSAAATCQSEESGSPSISP
jgi:hypothetical protein